MTENNQEKAKDVFDDKELEEILNFFLAAGEPRRVKTRNRAILVDKNGDFILEDE